MRKSDKELKSVMETYEERCEEREWLRDAYTDVDSMLLLNDVIQSFDKLQSSDDIAPFESGFGFSPLEEGSKELLQLKIEPGIHCYITELQGHIYAILKHRSYERGVSPYSVGREVHELSLHFFSHTGSALISHKKAL